MLPHLDVHIQPQNLELVLSSCKCSRFRWLRTRIEIGPQYPLYLQPPIFRIDPSPTKLLGVQQTLTRHD